MHKKNKTNAQAKNKTNAKVITQRGGPGAKGNKNNNNK
jgi:hypothetical protein